MVSSGLEIYLCTVRVEALIRWLEGGRLGVLVGDGLVVFEGLADADGGGEWWCVVGSSLHQS